jgi:CheY-like chemotaxis protein
MRQITILVAEDDEDYAFFIGRALENLNFMPLVRVLTNGEQVINYLSGEGKYADRPVFPYPDILFTDLKMPRMSGLEVLGWMQENPELAIMPTIVLSSSSDPGDISRAYDLGAKAFLVKPPSFNVLEEMLQSSCRFWLQGADPDFSPQEQLIFAESTCNC